MPIPPRVSAVAAALGWELSPASIAVVSLFY
jgi:hypothetical protein